MDMLEKLEADERELVFDSFSHDRALELGFFLVEKAKEKGLAVAVRIDRNGQTLFHCALPGTTISNDQWLAGKINVVYHFHHSSFWVKHSLLSKGKTLDRDHFLEPGDFRAHGGAFPIFVKGTGLVAAAAVSGLPDHEDHQFLTESIRNFMGD